LPSSNKKSTMNLTIHFHQEDKHKHTHYAALTIQIESVSDV